MFNFFTDIRTALKNIEAKVDALFHINTKLTALVPSKSVAVEVTPATVETPKDAA